MQELAAGATPAPGDVIEEIELKPRTLDPSVLIAGKALPLSSIDLDYARSVAEYRASKKGRRRFRVALP